jgi:hypothetical protein
MPATPTSSESRLTGNADADITVTMEQDTTLEMFTKRVRLHRGAVSEIAG